MKLYKLWNKRRPRRIGLIPIWTGFLTLLIALLIFYYFFSMDFMSRDVTFYPMNEELDEFVIEAHKYIPLEYHDDYYFNFYQHVNSVLRGIETTGIGSFPHHKKGWTIRHFGDRERSEKQAKHLYVLVRAMLKQHFEEHETLSDFYKKGRIEYSTQNYNLYAKYNPGLKKFPEEVYEVWLGPVVQYRSWNER